MKIEKRGNGYRVRKMINGNMHRILFDHMPSKREIDEVFSKIYAESPSGAVQGTFKDCALQSKKTSSLRPLCAHIMLWCAQ